MLVNTVDCVDVCLVLKKYGLCLVLVNIVDYVDSGVKEVWIMFGVGEHCRLMLVLMHCVWCW